MIRRTIWCAAVFGLGAACGDAEGVSPDAIRSAEKAAVLAALECALSADSIYPSVAQFILPYIDRASHLVSPGGDTTRLVGIQLTIDAVADDTPLELSLIGALAWTGFDSMAHTVDTTVLLLGTGGTAFPINDALAANFVPGTAGRGTGYVIHSQSPETCAVWLARTGTLTATSASFGRGVSQPAGPLTLTNHRGTITGEYAVTARLVPDSSTTVSSARTYSAGVQALHMRVTGTLTLP